MFDTGIRQGSVLSGVMALGMLAGAYDAEAAFTNNGFFLTQGLPDIASSGIDVVYTAPASGPGLGSLTANGFATALFKADGTSVGLDGGFGDFTLAAAIFDTTGDANTGSLRIDGKIASEGAVSGNLLTGNLSGFGSQAGSGELQFQFDITDGDLAGIFGSTVGVKLNNAGLGSFDPTTAFLADFSNATQAGVANTFSPGAVPAPGSLALLLAGGVLGFLSRRRRT